MRFRILTTTGGEVTFAGVSRRDKPVYYGVAPDSGLWRVSLSKLEDFLAKGLAAHTFGSSIEEYVFGFEIAELDEWGRWFNETREYASYRAKSKQLVMVGQLEWRSVKDLTLDEQLVRFSEALVTSIEQIPTLKRGPKDFDHVAFADYVRQRLASCDPSSVAAV